MIVDFDVNKEPVGVPGSCGSFRYGCSPCLGNDLKLIRAWCFDYSTMYFPRAFNADPPLSFVHVDSNVSQFVLYFS